MKSLVATYSIEIEDGEEELRAKAEPRKVSRESIVIRQKERDELLEMGIISSDEYDNLYAATMHVNAAYSDHTCSKSACLNNELAH